jgi:hypothetical protein
MTPIFRHLPQVVRTKQPATCRRGRRRPPLPAHPPARSPRYVRPRAVCVRGRDAFVTESVHGKKRPHRAHFTARMAPHRAHFRAVCVHGGDPFVTQSVHGARCPCREAKKCTR